ncbi:MAG TPA: serine hydrolase [Dehalococcoidia bacterium]
MPATRPRGPLPGILAPLLASALLLLACTASEGALPEPATPTPSPTATAAPLPSPTPTATAVPDVPARGEGTRTLPAVDPALQSAIEAALGGEVGSYGVVAWNLSTGTGAAVNPDKVFYAASLFKLPLMHEAFRQRELGLLDFSETLEVTEEVAAEDLGTLEQAGIAVGDLVPVSRLLELMVTWSDNTSAVLLHQRLGGRNVDAGLRELGLTSTSVNTRELPTTAGDMAALLRAVAAGEAVSSQASAEMEALLLAQRVRDRIPAGVPRGVRVGNKTANWENATHDVAIVYAPAGTYVLAVLSDKPGDAATLVRISRLVYQHFNP